MINFKQFLVENFVINEGMHWPADYKQKAISRIKTSPIGQQTWYTDDFIQKDVDTFVDEFSSLSHKNSNLGFFLPIVRWFIEYSGTSKQKYQEFIERKLDGIIGTLGTILNDKSYDSLRDQIKQKWTLTQFEELQKKIDTENKNSSAEKEKNIVKRDDYEIIPFFSYEELREKFGGDKTGYKGFSEWCHSNGESTYDTWTKNGKLMFFVIANKNWKDIKPPVPETTNAYDEYGLSLIAILVDTKTGDLLNETLRWNHIIDPSKTNPGASVDKAFKNNIGELSQAVGMDVKQEISKILVDKKAELEKLAQTADTQVQVILSSVTTINTDTIPKKFRKYVTELNIPENVTEIGQEAFEGCEKLIKVTIPSSVTSIGESAFRGCKNLTIITIPDSVKIIDHYAFAECERLMNVTLGNSVESIGVCAFEDCSNLMQINIPDGVVSIGNYAFNRCTHLTKMTLPNTVTRIGNDAFHYCRILKSITIPGSVRSIERMTFYGCFQLESVTIGNGVENIKRNAFSNCYKLTNLNIPNSVKSIEMQAFYGCTALESIDIPNSVTNIGYRAFTFCEKLTSINIPDSVKVIDEQTFTNCKNLTHVTIGNGVSDIDNRMFYKCPALKSVTIGKNVTNIKSGAFSKCQELESLTISDRLMRIGDRTFEGCSKLKTVYVYGDIEKVRQLKNWPAGIEFKQANEK